MSSPGLQLDRIAVQQTVQEVVQRLLDELGSHRGLAEIRSAVHADSVQALHLERDLGLGSLERVELMVRAGDAFHARLPDELMADANTLGDVITAIEQQIANGAATEVRNGTVAAVRGNDSAAGESFAATAAELGLDKAETLIEVLRRRARAEPDRVHLRLREDDGSSSEITLGALFERVTAIARGLENMGIAPGERVAILLPTGAEFFHVFLGAQMAGAIPVPIYPPFRADRIEEYASRQSAILRSAEVSWMVTFSRAEKVARMLKPKVPSLRGVTTAAQLAHVATRPGQLASERGVRGEDIAFLQYTSGSTGDPKGVTLTHANLLANIRAIAGAIDFNPRDQAISWLPLYHDMGLIGAWMTPLYCGSPLTLMSPLAFLSRPERWLWAIHQSRGTITAAPNFAYELCVRKVTDEQIAGIDLSSMRCMLNGAEPVNPVTLERFAERFAKYGFRGEAMLPVYGLAENSVALTFPPKGRGPLVDTIERGNFEREGRATPASAGTADSDVLSFVSCGSPIEGNEIRLVDDKGEDVPERVEARLWFRGPSATTGYYRNPEATRAVMRPEGWIDSGDRAYCVDGEYYITGRAKDIIIKAGRNLYPHEVEELAGSVKGVRKGCVVAFGAVDAQAGTERLVVVAESNERGAARQQEIIAAIQQKISESLGLPPDLVELVPSGTVPKTSSGKLRRDSTKQLYLSGRLGVRRAPAWMQVARLAAASVPHRAASAVRRGVQAIYGAYFLLMVGLLAASVWAVLQIVPDKALAARIAHRMNRAFFILVGCPLRVEGMEHLAALIPVRGKEPRPGALIACNHTSFIDVVVLLALVGHYDFRFVAKQEVMSYPFIGGILRKLGFYSFVRESREARLKQADEVEEGLRRGQSVLIFVEGTFTPAPGLRPFQLGAFKAAAASGRPVIPMAVRGTREILRDETILPKPGRVTLTICPPLEPAGTGWREILRLRDAARTAIGQHCGEPVL
jgi:fatty-acyl-CoA synthase